MTRIESRQNATLKHLARLAREKKYRQTTGQMVCEGEKMLFEALESGARVKTVLVRETDAPGGPSRELIERAAAQGAALFLAPAGLFALASDVETPQGVVFCCETPVLGGELPAVRSAVLLDGVQDPGNIGTILRTAEAFGLEAVVLCEGCADASAPKVARATMGAVFRQKIYRMPLEAAVAALHGQGLPVYAAALRADSVPVTDMELARCAVVIGSEGHGVTARALALCDQSIIIPMAGRAESLNAGVAASLLIWEMTKRRE